MNGLQTHANGLEIDISCGYLRSGERDEGKEKKADLEGSAEDAEFDKRHWIGGGSEERNRGQATPTGSRLLCPLHSTHTDVIQIG